MARKDELASRLGGSERPTRRPGWRDTINAPMPVEAVDEPEAEVPAPPVRATRKKVVPADSHVRKTYILTPQLVERIAALADRERVAINELVRFLLTEALLQVENRELSIPTRPARRRINMEEF